MRGWEGRLVAGVLALGLVTTLCVVVADLAAPEPAAATLAPPPAARADANASLDPCSEPPLCGEDARTEGG